MSTATTPADILDLIFTDLDAWARENRGRASLTKNPYDLIEILQQRPGGWRLVLHWEGDGRGDERVLAGGVLDNRIRIILDGDLGPTPTPAIALFRSTSGRETPLLSVLDAVRFRVLSYRFNWLRPPLNSPVYQGADDKIPLPAGDYLAAYNLSFSLYSVMRTPADGDVIELGAE